MTCPLHQSTPDEAHADRLLAATLYLMTCHARNGCPRLAAMIRCHLQLIAANPGASERVVDISRKLASAWTAIERFDQHASARAEPQRSEALH